MVTNSRTGLVWAMFAASAYWLAGSRIVLAANNLVAAEGVSDYSAYRNIYGPLSANDIDMAQEASGFYNGMTPSGSPWSPGVFYTDNLVYDSDFYDPDLNSAGGDTNNFDRAGSLSENAFAFAGAHGNCNDITTTLCNTTSDCPSLQVCPANPPSSYSAMCIKNTTRSLITSSSSSNAFYQYVYYGGGAVRWGEDAYSGGWAGAGTNGSNGVIFIANSCGSKSPFYNAETIRAFGGAILINFTMPQSNMNVAGAADLWTWQQRGSTLAAYALANPNASVSGGWAALIDNAPQNVGASCPDQTTNYSHGGGHGYSGCAANLSIAFAGGAIPAFNNLNVSWLNASNFANKPIGNTYGSQSLHCNYDCATYGLIK